MTSFTKIIVALILALFTVAGLQAGSKTSNTINNYSNWKTHKVDASIADEYIIAKFPTKPRKGIDPWTGYSFFAASAKKINYSIIVAPLSEFIKNESPDDFDRHAYSNDFDLKIAFLESIAEEVKEDSDEFEEISVLSLEIGEYAGFPTITFCLSDDDEQLSMKSRIVLSDYAAYVISVDSDLSKDAANNPSSDFFLDGIKIVTR